MRAFRFGENWADFATGLDAEAIRQAEAGLVRLLGSGNIENRSFLDIGCGSGLHALAALRLGAARVLAVDRDPLSVQTAERVLRAHAPDGRWEAREMSVFDLDPGRHGRFDIVYSWGVLHHTGAMREAIAKAAAMVAPGGLFTIALYRRTPLCRFWTWEKRLYAGAPARVQRAVQAVYVALFRLACLLLGRSFSAYVRGYRSNRGMDFRHDVHDWLGGYPYESIRPQEIFALASTLGFEPERSFLHRARSGILGTGCDEFTFRSRAG